MRTAPKIHAGPWLRTACRAILLLASLVLVAWQFLTFKEVVQRHTVQAREVSASAGWMGQPVGTMPQPHDSSALE